MGPASETVAPEAEQATNLTLELPVRRTWCDDSGERWFEGVASSTGLDRQKERMSQRALAMIARGLGSRTGRVKLLSGHPGRGGRREVEELGEVEECVAGPDQLVVRGRLRRGSAAAERLHQGLRSGREYGLSLGGRVRRAHWQLDDEARDMVRVIDEVELDHIAVCSPQQAVNPETTLRTSGCGERDSDKAGDGIERDRGLRGRVRAGLRRLLGRDGGTGSGTSSVSALATLGEAAAELAEVGSELGDLRAEVEASEVGRLKGAARPIAGRGTAIEGATESMVGIGGRRDAGHGMLQPAGGGSSLRGRRRSLEGQERTVGRGPVGRVGSEQLWKGVL